MGVGKRTVRSVALLLLLVTVGSAALWLRDGIRREHDERVQGFLEQVQVSAEDAAGYTARQGLLWIRHAVATLSTDPSPHELETYARASGFSSVTVFDDAGQVVSAWGPSEDRHLHLAALRRSLELGGPRVAGADDADRAEVISVALPYHPERHVAISVDVRETTVDWYLSGLASTVGADVRLVDGAGVTLLAHGPVRGAPPTTTDGALQLPPAGVTALVDGDVVAAAEVDGTPWRLAVAIDEDRLHRADPDVSRLPWVLVGLIVLAAVGAVGLVLRLDTVRRRADGVQTEYRRVVDQLQEGVICTSLHGELQMANRAALRLLGFDDLAQARARTSDVTTLLCAEDAEAFRRGLLDDGAVVGQKAELRRPGGVDGDVTHLSLSAQIIHSDDGAPWAIEGLIVDVSERHRVEQELRRRDLILRSAAVAASTLLRESDWGSGIQPALTTIGTGAGVERVFLFGVTGGDDPVADYLHEWVGEGVPAAIDAPGMHDVPMRAAGFERWIDVLSAGGTIVGDAASFPVSEQPLLDSVSARSLLVVPIMTRDGWWGFVGFAHVTGTRRFSTAETDALRVAAEVIAAAVDRSVDHARLEGALCEQARAAEELRVAGQVRDDFLSMVSHELRTPLTPILGFSHLLERQGVPEPQRAAGVSAIRRNARRMLGLVDDLLVYSRASSGRVGVVPVTVDVTSVVRSVLADLGLDGEVAVVTEGRPMARIDEGHLGHIVTNLVTNAVKYGKAGVAVEVGACGDDHVAVRVCDDGPGVPPAFVPQLFDRFTQASTGDRRTASGTGLGLAIVRLLTLANGAEISYRPNSPTGACFEVRMPAAVGTPALRLPEREPELL